MANGDAAAAAGMDVVPGTADLRMGYDEINKTRDYIAQDKSTGTRRADQITSGVFDPARVPVPKTVVDSGISFYKPSGFNQWNCSHNLAVLGATSVGSSLSVGTSLYAGGQVAFPAALGGIAGWSTLAIQTSSGVLGVPVSARKYKKNERPSDLAELAKIGQAVVTDFEYRAAFGGGKTFGLIADDLPVEQLKRYGDDGEIDGIDESRLVYAVLAYAQTLEARLAKLEGAS